MIDAFLNWVMSDWTGVLMQLFFVYTIVLMILDKQKPPVQTCLLTGTALIVLSLGGSFASSATSVIGVLNGLLWWVVGYQRWRQVK